MDGELIATNHIAGSGSATRSYLSDHSQLDLATVWLGSVLSASAWLWLPTFIRFRRRTFLVDHASLFHLTSLLE